MKKLTAFLILILLVQISYSHPWKPSHYVVIDTDAGIDDMRAISMLLASNDVKILGIIVSGGALSPYDGYKKVKSMLNSYHHEGIPVAMNYNVRGQDLPVPLSISWGDEEGITVPETNGFNKLCKNILEYHNTSFTIISLASLNSVAELTIGGLLPADRIERIIWSNNSLAKLGGFNAGIDVRSATRTIKGEVPLTVVGYPSEKSYYSNPYLENISRVNNRYAKKIVSTLSSDPDLLNHDFAISAADEMAVIYLHYPELFSSTKVKENQFVQPRSIDAIKSKALNILDGSTRSGHQVMKAIPVDTSFFQPDIQPFVEQIMDLYGKDEWESGVLASEMHRHLGIYSIIGVKMGIRARDYFGAGIDEISVVSSAGFIPPISCLNDGIQLSTGATTGHGLLKVIESDVAVSARFIHNGKSVVISLKSDLFNSISEELKDLSLVNGLDSDIYWEIVRQRAILYWKNLDRNKIFNIETIGD